MIHDNLKILGNKGRKKVRWLKLFENYFLDFFLPSNKKKNSVPRAQVEEAFEQSSRPIEY